MRKRLKFPVAYPRVHENAMCWPSGFQDGLEASPSPFVSRSTPTSGRELNYLQSIFQGLQFKL